VSYNQPVVADFKNQFVRDFPYGSNIETQILDADILQAITEASYQINPALFSDQGSYTIGFLYLAAHTLVVNIRGSSQGINGQFNFLQAGKGAAGVNESFAIPQRILNSPVLSVYTKTNYGMKYIMMVLPQLTGAMFTVCGRTNP
jgi:hypothetical protein